VKIWTGYGSEHSMNLVLIGKFKNERDADRSHELIKKLMQLAAEDENMPVLERAPEEFRFSDSAMDFIRKHQLYILTPAEIEQFAYDHHVDKNADNITVRTDESEISAFVKIFLDAGARIEIYSGHDYPSGEY